MKHAHVTALENLYKHFSSQDADAIFAHCADGATFQVEGKSPLAGKYTRDTLPAYFAKQLELAGGDYKFAVHDVMGSDQHAVVLCSETLGKGDKAKVLRQAHVWRFQDGKPLAGYVYARDLYAYDGAWT